MLTEKIPEVGHVDELFPDAEEQPTRFAHQRDIPNGTMVPITVQRKQVMGEKVGYLESEDKCLVKYGNHNHRRKIHGFGLAIHRSDTLLPEANSLVPQPVVKTTPENPASRFDIATRFKLAGRVAEMVAFGSEISMILAGSGGIGKSAMIISMLKERNWVSDDEANGEPEKRPDGDMKPKEDTHGEPKPLVPEDEAEEPDDTEGDEDVPVRPYDYSLVKGFSTPKAMYRHLYNNKGKLIIYDDCDSVLEHGTAVNLLKSALDSSGDRWIHWHSELDDGLPNRFKFTGKIIFISNKTLKQIPQMLLSRCHHVDVSMSTMDKIARIRALATVMCPELPMEAKEDVIQLMETLKDQTGDLNLRTFKKTCAYRAAFPEDWKDMAEYFLTTSMGE